MSKKTILVSDLKPGYRMFGNHGNVWNDNAHIENGGSTTMCDVPMLSRNWCRMEDVKHIGCPKCIKLYEEEMEMESNS